jgi:hypothetical protein
LMDASPIKVAERFDFKEQTPKPNRNSFGLTKVQSLKC